MRFLIEKARSVFSPVIPVPAVGTVQLRPGEKPYPENFMRSNHASRQSGRLFATAPGEMNDDAVRTIDSRICFTAGTLVKTPDGMRKIETIKTGDLVMTVDPETGRMFPARVTETFVHNVNNVYRLTYADGSTLNTTWNHPFWVKGQGWTEARYLAAGSESVAVNAGPQWRVVPTAYSPGAVSPMDVYGGVRVAEARRVFTSSIVKVYNIEVEGTHAYLVGERGVLVHNYPWVPAVVSAGGALLMNCIRTPSCSNQLARAGAAGAGMLALVKIAEDQQKNAGDQEKPRVEVRENETERTVEATYKRFITGYKEDKASGAITDVTIGVDIEGHKFKISKASGPTWSPPSMNIVGADVSVEVKTAPDGKTKSVGVKVSPPSGGGVIKTEVRPDGTSSSEIGIKK